MIIGENTCRFCLKFAANDDLVPLFEIEDHSDTKEVNSVNWRRVFSFVFHYEGIPDKICTFCQSQLNWISEFYRTVFDNDCYLRNELTKKQMMAEFGVPESVKPEDSDVEGENASIGGSNEFHNTGNEYGDEKDGLLIPDDLDVAENLSSAADSNDSDFEGFNKKGKKRKRTARQSEATFKCDLCDKLFKTRKTLTRHKRVHDASYIPNLKCSFCDQIFSSKYARNRHELKMHGESRSKNTSAINLDIVKKSPSGKTEKNPT